jgi:O-antigen/teichoic acid export membrane protein
MPLSLSNVVLHAFSLLWHLMFHEAPPNGLLRHLDRFMAFGLGMVAAKFLSVAAQILIGRTLGQADYGTLTIMLLLAGYLAVPITGGWGHAFTRIVAQETDSGKRLAALNSLLMVSMLLCLLVCGTLFALRGNLVDWIGIDRRLVDVTLVMGLLCAWWTLAKQIAQAFQAWRTYVFVEASLSVVLLAAVLVLVFTGRADISGIGVVFWIAYGLAGMGALRFVAAAIRRGVVGTYVKPILHHGGFMLLTGLVTVSTYSMDRIIIQKTLGPADVGLYQAHFLATFGVISALLTILMTYLFPIFCRDEEGVLHRHLGRASLLQYPVTMMVSAVVGRAVLWLYGYPVNPQLLMCLTLFGAVQFHVQIKAWYLSSRGADTALVALGSQLTFLVLNAMILLLLVDRLGITSGGFALLAAALGSLLFLTCSKLFIR